jgi:hypothetical protein
LAQRLFGFNLRLLIQTTKQNKMKRFATICAIALGVFSMTSCKKDWTCTCTAAGLAGTPITIANATKSDAEDACSSLEILGNTCELEKK